MGRKNVARRWREFVEPPPRTRPPSHFGFSMKRHRVLYVAKTAKGGSAFSLYHLVRALDTTWYEPIVLFYTQQHPYIGNRLAQLGIKTMTLDEEKDGVRPDPVSPEPQQRDVGGWLMTHVGRRVSRSYVFVKACYEFIRQDARRVQPLVHVLREQSIDLMHINTGLRGGKSGIIAAWLTKTPCICHVRMFDDLNYFDKLFGRFVHAFIFISQAIAAHYAEQGMIPNNGTVIHNAVELSDFPTNLDVSSVRSEFGWSAQERLVGIVGRLDWWKGHEHYLKAMAQVARTVPNLRGLIVGEPEYTPINQRYYRQLRSLTKTLALEDKVLFTGFRADVPRLLAAMDVVVLSSSAPEPFGRVVIEAMAAGKPVVATAAGGVLDIIEDGVNGLLVPCQDSQALAEAIVSLLSNPYKAQQMGESARRCVEAKFTVHSQAVAVKDVYETVLEKREHQRLL